MKITLDTIKATADEISECDEEWPVVSISKKEIIKIQLCYGFCTERPIAVFVISILCIVIGLYSTINMAISLFNHFGEGHLYGQGLGMNFSILALSVVGFYLLKSSFKRSYYFKVFTENDARNLIFQNNKSKQEVTYFCYQLQETLGYQITSKLKVT